MTTPQDDDPFVALYKKFKPTEIARNIGYYEGCEIWCAWRIARALREAYELLGHEDFMLWVLPLPIGPLTVPQYWTLFFRLDEYFLMHLPHRGMGGPFYPKVPFAISLHQLLELAEIDPTTPGWQARILRAFAGDPAP